MVRFLIAAFIAGVILVPGEAALAKSGKAWLVTPIYLATAPGTTLRVAWVVRDDDGSSFNAIGVFVRLLSKGGGEPTEGFASATAHVTGEYEADVVVPAGGIGGIEVGIAGIASGPGMPARRSDGLFPIANVVWTQYEVQPVATPPPDRWSAPGVTALAPDASRAPSVAPTDEVARERGRVLISLVGIAGLLAIGVLAIRRRLRSPRGTYVMPAVHGLPQEPAQRYPARKS